MRVKITGLNEYTVGGKKYRYWRRAGVKQIAVDPRLKGAALAAKIAELERIHLSKKTLTGTLKPLVNAYKDKSDHWNKLRARTQKDYDRVFNWLGGSMDCSLVEFTPPEIAAIRDKAKEEHEPKFANQVLTTLKMVFAYGYEQGIVPTNPAKDIQKLSQPKKRPNRPCSPQEAVALINLSPVQLRPAIALSLYTGLRFGDVCALSKASIDGDWLKTFQGKTRNEVLLYICDDLKWILEGIPKNDATTVCVKLDGTPWRPEGLKQAFQNHKATLLRNGDIGAGVTFHGLRHTVSTLLSEAGYLDTDIAHIMGHSAKTITGHYRKSAEHKNLLTEMALKLEEAYRKANGNIEYLKNDSAT